MPEISVIVPVYRAEAFLRKCTESHAWHRTMGELEVLRSTMVPQTEAARSATRLPGRTAGYGFSTRRTAG